MAYMVQMTIAAVLAILSVTLSAVTGIAVCRDPLMSRAEISVLCALITIGLIMSVLFMGAARDAMHLAELGIAINLTAEAR